MKQKGNKALLALTAASLGLPLVSKQTNAQTIPENWSTSYRYSEYSENEQPAELSADGAVDRYTIEVHQLTAGGPILPSTAISLSLVSETMSGASPWFITPDADGEPVQTLSGATIEEQRDEVSVGIDQYGEHARTGFGVSFSSENDYESIGVRLNHSSYSDDKNSTIDFAIGGSVDSITPTQAPGIERPTSEGKSNVFGSVGLSHVFTRTLVVGISGSYSVFEGYLSDPYKLAWVDGNLLQDSRPDDKRQAAFDLRVRKYLTGIDTALHADYRHYGDSFGVVSDTLKLAAFKNLGSWQVSASTRFYLQDSANFYREFFVETRADGYYSSDYRLSDFQALSYKVGLNKKFSFGAIRLSYEIYDSDSDDVNPGLVDFSLFSVGFDYSFR
ncbi:MAG: DUF3570 domain-containing protein [Pseudomonadota bacterium]